MWWKVLAAVVILVGLAVFFVPREVSDHEQIQQSLHNIVRGVADKNSRQVLTEISESYIDQTGWRKKNIRGILFQQFQQKQSFSLKIVPSAFNIQSPVADVTAEVTVFGGSMWNPNAETQVYLVSFSYEKEPDGVWRMQGHTREKWEQ